MKEESKQNTNTGGKKVVLASVVFFLLGFGIAWLVIPSNGVEKNNPPEEIISEEPSNDVNALEVNDQKPGMFVEVKSVKFEHAGWVAIHEDRDGKPGNILGAAWLPAGENSGKVELLRGTVAGNTYFAMLHNDNGDKQFDHKIDVPLLDASGTPVITKFMVTDSPLTQ